MYLRGGAAVVYLSRRAHLLRDVCRWRDPLRDLRLHHRAGAAAALVGGGLVLKQPAGSLHPCRQTSCPRHEQQLGFPAWIGGQGTEP